jgi:hypothetical protein
VGTFFIDSESGRIATQRQLAAAGLGDAMTPPPRPWHPIRASGDATTLWYAALRKQERGIWLGTLAFRHGDHHSLLLRQGWEEVPHEEIVAFGPAAPSDGGELDEDLADAVRILAEMADQERT